MSLIKLKYVVSFTSQDKKYSIENLMKLDGSGRWMCAPEDRTGKLEAVLQLERACHISHIDIGTFRALCLTIQVGRSSWDMGKQYKDLVVGTTMMSPTEARSGAGKNCMKMFKYDSFCTDARDEGWDRIKIILTQPFRKDVQFGLSLLRIMSSETMGQDSSSVSSNSCVSNASSGRFSTATPARSVSNKNNYNSPSWRSTEDIKRHFFKKDQEGNKREEEVKNTLLKIGTTAENGSSQGVLTSRITKMLMAAAGKSPAYKPAPFPSRSNATSASPKTPAESPKTSESSATESARTPMRKSAKLTFEQEVSKFLDGLEIENLDLNKMSFADLRHQLEKIKCRKLSKEEKKKFFVLATEFIKQITSSETKDQGNKRKPSSDQQEEPVPKKRQIEKEDVSLAERLGRSPENRTYLTALKTPGSLRNTNDSTLNSKQGKGNDHSSSSSPAFGKSNPDVQASPLLKKSGTATFLNGKSFDVDVTPRSKRGAFEAMLEGENDLGVFGVTSMGVSPKVRNKTPSGTSMKKENTTPKSAAKETAVSKVKKTPARTPLSQPAPANVWLSKGKGVKLYCNSETPGSSEKVGKPKKGVKSKKQKCIEGEDMVPCPMCNKKFAASKIQLHAAACGILSSEEEEDDVIAVPGSSNSHKTPNRADHAPGGFLASESPSYGFYLPSQSHDTPDMVECPLCFEKFPNWRIEHHTNKCLAAGKS